MGLLGPPSASLGRRKEQKEEQKETGSGPPTQAIDARMGEEEKDRKQKEKQKKQGVCPQLNYLDHSVTSYDPHGSYNGPNLNSRPQG